jgi:hemoglobin
VRLGIRSLLEGIVDRLRLDFDVTANSTFRAPQLRRKAGAMLKFAREIVATSMLAISGVVALTPAAAQTAAPASPSLYQRVGGYDFVARFVDTAFPRVATHPQLRRMFQGHSTDSQLRQRQLIVDALCKEMGGPCIYIGRPMKPLHDGLHITESDWAVFMGIINSTLVELKVPERERGDWSALFDRAFRPGIVESASK